MANNQLLASDNLASGSLAAGWSVINGVGWTLPQVTGAPHYAEASAILTLSGCYWSGLAWTNDQTSEVTVQKCLATGTLVLFVRMQAGAYSGYQLNLNPGVGGSQLYRIDAGVATSIKALPTQTFTAGDVYTVQVAGSCISVYKNNLQIVFKYDTTYTSGSPGFACYSTAAVTDTQISAWRGYNAVQQDGIWTKQGIVLPALAGDLSGPSEGTQNPSIIGPETGEILTGQQVWKMYFAAGASATDVGYAESPVADGINWTRGSNIISGVGICVSAIKVGGTYHIYAQSAYGGNVKHYTSSSSSSGWSLQSANVFAGRTGLVYFSAITVISGTWHALYTIADGTFPSTLNLATSSDGISWTDYPSNPVASNFWGVVAANQIGSTWYAWGQTVNTNARETTKPGIDPVEGLRMQTTDFINWTNPVKSIHYSQMFEGVNEPNGGAASSFVIDINGHAYQYYSAGPDDAISTASSILQIGVATAAAPIASIVTEAEAGIQQVASDDFTSGAGDLSGNWVTPTGGTKLKIVSGPYCEASATGTNCEMLYTGASFSNDQYSEITLKTLATGLYFAIPTVRGQTGALSFYWVNIQGPTNSLQGAVTIYKKVAGTDTQIGPFATSVTLQPNDVIRLTATGSSPVLLSVYQNDYLVLQVEDWSNALTSGHPGIFQYANTVLTNSQISLWAGGNVGTFTISGNAGVAGATVSYVGTTFSGSVTADGSGNYVTPPLSSDSYTITPSLAGHTFLPLSPTVAVAGANITNFNFVADWNQKGRQLLASDTFASGSLAAGWTNIFGFLKGQVVGSGASAVVEPNATVTVAGQLWNEFVWPSDQTSEVTAAALTANGSVLSLQVRFDTATLSGYQVNITVGTPNTAILYKLTNGSAVQLGSTVSGLTYAAGDVWSLTAWGPTLVLYQNYNKVLQWVDTTHTSGDPGFSQVASSVITNVKVSSWRGYSGVQQDGIWTKQGAARISYVASDIDTGVSQVNSGLDSASQILHEGNAQILSGTVYKQWFGTASGIQYAESTDCINWTRYGSTLIAGMSFPQVIKSGSTYYLYCQSNILAPGQGNIRLYTSTDGVTLSLINSNVIAKGTAGQWDDNFIYLFSPVDIVAGTWRALYSGGNSSTFAMGLATSPDGITWTKYGSNPVTSRIWASTPYLINGTYYMWGSAVPPGLSATYDPSPTGRLYSTDLINWSAQTPSLHNSELADGVNELEGFAYATSLTTVGDTTFMYYESGPANTASDTGSSWNLSFATTLATLAQIVTQPENAISQVVADPFTSGAGDLPASWTIIPTTTKCKIIAGPFVEPTATATICGELYTGTSFDDDQYSEVTLHSLLNTSSFLILAVRGSVSTFTEYEFVITGATGVLSAVHCYFYKRLAAGGSKQLGPTLSLTPQVGDVFTVTVIGNTLSCYQNGWLVGQVEDVDNSITSGSPGFWLYSPTTLTDAQISGWAGGDANVLPDYAAQAGAGDFGFNSDFGF